MIDIIVKVPEDRVGEFYSMFGAWLNGSAQEPSLSGNATVKTCVNGQLKLPVGGHENCP